MTSVACVPAFLGIITTQVVIGTQSFTHGGVNVVNSGGKMFMPCTLLDEGWGDHTVSPQHTETTFSEGVSAIILRINTYLPQIIHV